ncbi:MAG: tRNA glutamyl-Q(34) synthetase GluQRS [Myxococcaceae bacterium]
MPIAERGRFAPSPTGELHLGNARTAILAWLWARSAGGGFTMRVEDLDRPRVRPGLAQRQLEELAWLGITWDEGPDPRTGRDAGAGARGPYWQSQRDALYEAAVRRLGDHVYECFCSRAEIARAASAPHGPLDEGPVYPGTCRRMVPVERTDRKPALRFIPSGGVTAFEDLIHGRYEQDVEQLVGDFVVRKNDGIASYQLAVVVDDSDSGITHVLRGDDLLASTPRQLQLYEALGRVAPRFAHVPLLLGEDGKRMAKREGASAIAELRERGVPAERVIGVMAKWSGLGDGQPVSARELARGFSLQNVRREPTVVSERELEELARA